MNINWKVRMKNKAFWLAFIPALLLLVQAIASLFGITLEMAGVSAKLIDIVNAAFVVLTLIGVVNDPTTAGTSDSIRALNYTEPHNDFKYIKQ